MSSWPFIIAMTSIICLFVVLPWMGMRHAQRLSEIERDAKKSDSEDTEDMRRIAARLEARVRALERILDDEAPGWRRKHDE